MIYIRVKKQCVHIDEIKVIILKIIAFVSTLTILYAQYN